jgi:hypothetical protein
MCFKICFKALDRPQIFGQIVKFLLRNGSQQRLQNVREEMRMKHACELIEGCGRLILLLFCAPHTGQRYRLFFLNDVYRYDFNNSNRIRYDLSLTLPASPS